MNNQAEAALNSTLPIEEVTRVHQTNDKYFKKPEGTLITEANEDIVRFNGYYGLTITEGNHKGAEGAFFTIDTNMWVTTEGTDSTAQYYLQFILSMDGKSSLQIPFTGTFTKLPSGEYRLQQKAEGVGGMDHVNLDLTFTRSQSVTTADVKGTVTFAAPGQEQSTVSGSTYNNPILPTTYNGTYYDKKDQKVTLEISPNNVLKFRADSGIDMQRIGNYRFNLNMYVFAFPDPADSNATISLVMGTSPASGLVCGNLKTINNDSSAAPTSRTLYTIKAPVTPPKMGIPNLSSNEVAPFAAYYPTPTAEYPDAFIAIQAALTPLIGEDDIVAVTVGISLDGKTSTVYNFEQVENSSFDASTNTLTLANPAHVFDALAPKHAAVLTFNREYIQGEKSGSLITVSGTILGKEITPAHTPFNLIPLDGFSGAVLKNENGETLVVTAENEVTYKGHKVGLGQPENILYVPIMYILEFTNPEPPKDEIAGLDYKVVCSWGTDAEQGLACIVTEYTLKDKGTKVVSKAISYYHSVPKS